jgi:prepilin-type N-terminal cleavage/methylation domain-containing protein
MPPVRGAAQDPPQIHRQTNPKGFTLVELIVVIVILGILLAIAIPALTGYIQKAGAIKEQAYTDTIAKALQTWATERYADGLIGNSALVKPPANATDAAKNLTHPPAPYKPSLFPYTAETWLGIVEEYAKLNLDPTEWSIVDIRFDESNKLLGFRLKNESSQDSLTYGTTLESFSFMVQTAGTTHTIPTVGLFSSGSAEGKYNWLVSVDSGFPVAYQSNNNTAGIVVSVGTPGEHTIKIEENVTGDENTYQWLRALAYRNTPGTSVEVATLISPLPERGMNVSENNAGNYYANEMFWGCGGNFFTMGDAFTIPQSIDTVGVYFCNNMFLGCNGAAFNMGASFNLPQKITGAPGNFCSGMFRGVWGDTFTMNSIFNLPQKITGAVGGGFCAMMFSNADGDAFNMNSIFTIPSGITSTGETFCFGMFHIYGTAFTMNSVFSLPQNITTVDSNFCERMFSRGSMSGVFIFQVNSVFTFPKLSDTELNKATVFTGTFLDIATAQTRTATSIINGNNVPASDKDTFGASFSSGADWSTLDANWKQ